MENNTQEKDLIERNESTIFGKIKNFFRNLFKKKEISKISEEKEVDINEEKKQEFKEYVKKTEDEDTQLLDLQRRYRKGEIGDNDLTEEQIEALCDLYDRQIISLKKSIEAKQQQITEYKKEINDLVSKKAKLTGESSAAGSYLKRQMEYRRIRITDK